MRVAPLFPGSVERDSQLGLLGRSFPKTPGFTCVLEGYFRNHASKTGKYGFPNNPRFYVYFRGVFQEPRMRKPGSVKLMVSEHSNMVFELLGEYLETARLTTGGIRLRKGHLTRCFTPSSVNWRKLYGHTSGPAVLRKRYSRLSFGKCETFVRFRLAMSDSIVIIIGKLLLVRRFGFRAWASNPFIAGHI
ncbi:1269_t:CDS:2 [Acaulospora morrowiae]|uniref:1269_t:CDS:1 n=1 Tax=Acaulospora morrowiae TaxID=94023 RepID=A0A9N9H520_9GLOM|nr:1269_t:CDS:2 [Acaulospora morrowiae]